MPLLVLSTLLGAALGPLIHFTRRLSRQMAELNSQMRGMQLTREAEIRDRQQREDAERKRHAEVQHNLDVSLDLILSRAESELAMLNTDWDAADNRTYAFLALNVAIGAALIAARDSVQPWWWTLLIGLGISSALFAVTLWPRRFDTGPNLRKFYDMWATSPAVTVKLQMYGELLNSIETNQAHLRAKSGPFYWGAITLVITVVAGGPVVGLTTAFHH